MSRPTPDFLLADTYSALAFPTLFVCCLDLRALLVLAFEFIVIFYHLKK